MRRAQVPTAMGKERTQLIAARHACHLSQDEVAAELGVSKVTVHRWEKAGDMPQPLHLRKLCDLFGKSAAELGFPESTPESKDMVCVTQGYATTTQESESEPLVLTAFRQHHLTSRLMLRIWNWPPDDVRYQELQRLIVAELEDNTMNSDPMSRRDALRFLALVPVDMLGLSPLRAVFKKPFSYEDVLKHCAVGIVVCWKLRKAKEYLFADSAVSAYIPTLKAIVHTAPASQRKAAAALLAQCFLLKSPLSWHIATTNVAVTYAQQAEAYSIVAENRLLQVIALKMQAAALCYAHQWAQSLQVTEKANYLLKERDKRDRQKQISVAPPAEAPLPQLLHSYIYAGLATYQARNGQKEPALRSLQNAHTAFFAQPEDEAAPIWVDHSLGNLLLHDGTTHMHLGLYKEAVTSFGHIETQYAQHGQHLSCLIEATFDQVIVETSRDDQPRSLERCINLWIQGINGAKKLQSQQRFDEAIHAYTAMRAAWPGERQVKDLHDLIVHW